MVQTEPWQCENRVKNVAYPRDTQKWQRYCQHHSQEGQFERMSAKPAARIKVRVGMMHSVEPPEGWDLVHHHMRDVKAGIDQQYSDQDPRHRLGKEAIQHTEAVRFCPIGGDRKYAAHRHTNQDPGGDNDDIPGALPASAGSLLEVRPPVLEGHEERQAADNEDRHQIVQRFHARLVFRCLHCYQASSHVKKTTVSKGKTLSLNCSVSVEISNLGFEMRDLSDFEISLAPSHEGHGRGHDCHE